RQGTKEQAERSQTGRSGRRVSSKRAGKVQRSRQSVVRRAGSGTIRQTRYQSSRLESGQE
ncbi:unnamed protein product, partial [Staurois parvus]